MTVSATGIITPPHEGASTEMGKPKELGLRLPDGVYVPTLAFFKDDESLDRATLEKHLVRLLNAGVAGIVVHGSNGEAAHLDYEERRKIIETARDVINMETWETRIPLIAGCGAQSTRETIRLCKDAARSGATHALILPPSYYNSLLPDAKIVAHFHAVADASPVPLLVYNFPGAAAGRDLSSDVILKIAQHPRVVGVKLTCGNTGKLARIADAAPEGFFVAGGSADFILQGQVVGAHGTISGLANICPRACVRIMELASQGKLREARRLQAVVARADWVAIQTGFAGVKASLQTVDGYGGVPRLPTTEPDSQTLDMIVDGMNEVRECERQLEVEAKN